MRIGLLMNLAPRKLGSMENWLVALCRLARMRGHAIDAFTLSPVHPEVVRDLAGVGCGLERVEDLQRSWLGGIRRLASYDVLHLNLFQPRTRVALMAYAAWPARVLLCDHSSGPAPESAAPPPRVKRWLDQLTCFRVEGMIGVSEYVRSRDEVRYRLDAQRTRTVYNGVDVRRFHPRTMPSAPTAQVTVLTVAHLIPQKGVDVLLRALAAMEVSSARLIIAGDGPQAVNLRRLAHELGVAGRVTFAGLRDDVQLLLEQADVFVHPATWAEAFGLTIAEAMALERPVVASRIGGIPEIIEHGSSGVLFTPGDSAALARELDRLIRSPQERLRLGAAARLRVLSKFTLETCVEGHLRWAEELAGVAPRGARVEFELAETQRVQPGPSRNPELADRRPRTNRMPANAVVQGSPLFDDLPPTPAPAANEPRPPAPDPDAKPTIEVIEIPH